LADIIEHLLSLRRTNSHNGRYYRAFLIIIKYEFAYRSISNSYIIILSFVLLIVTFHNNILLKEDE